MILSDILIVLSLVILCIIRTTHSAENNVCPTYADYYTIKNNTNCYYDFAAEFDAPTIIRMHGYEVMEYKVQTQDGHILTLFRIVSHNVNNPLTKHYPVYLQHGLVATCANFIALGKDSLAFMLADSGHDVWLGNFRGNQYSEGHTSLSVFDEEFWNHSMDEIVVYDFPAIFHTIIRNTPPKAQIIYIGHSLGTTLMLMYAAEFPEQARNMFKLVILLSPAYTLSNMISPYKVAAPFGLAIVDAVNRLNMIRIVSQAEPLRRVVRQFCLESPPLMQLCMQLYNLFYGKNTQLGPEHIPVYFNQLPGGTSLKILNHAADLVLNNFRKYNYGPENVKYYGASTPPEYNIKNVHVPVYIVYSTQDWATTEKDAWNLYHSLPKHARHGIRKIDRSDFNHIDFVFGRHAREIVYENLLTVIEDVVNEIR